MVDEPDGYEILEHTADVGVRAWGPNLEEVFRQVALGMTEITGGAAEETSRRDVTVEAGDVDALLVEWLGELIYVQESTDSAVRDVEVALVADGTARGSVALGIREEATTGTPVKAITYHQLSVERSDDGWTAQVFFDI